MGYFFLLFFHHSFSIQSIFFPSPTSFTFFMIFFLFRLTTVYARAHAPVGLARTRKLPAAPVGLARARKLPDAPVCLTRTRKLPDAPVGLTRARKLPDAPVGLTRARKLLRARAFFF
jgi:hypothetical protein